MATRRRIVSAKIAEDAQSVAYNIHGPADADGKFPVIDTVSFSVDHIPADRLSWFALYGVSQVVSNAYNKLDDDVTPDDVRASVNAVLADIHAGTWAPGRTGFAEREPTDLELAMAEVMGRDVSEIMDHVDNDVQKNDDGTPKLDARGRQMRVFTKRMLDNIANDPAVKPVYARIVAERAKRLAAEAKSERGGQSRLGSLFGTPTVAEPTPADTTTAAAAQ